MNMLQAALLLVLSSLTNIYSTSLAIGLGLNEANPIARALMLSYGISGLILLKLVAIPTGLLLLKLVKAGNRSFIFWISVIQLIASINNLHQILYV